MKGERDRPEVAHGETAQHEQDAPAQNEGAREQEKAGPKRKAPPHKATWVEWLLIGIHSAMLVIAWIEFWRAMGGPPAGGLTA